LYAARSLLGHKTTARWLESGLFKRLPGYDELQLIPWELEDLEKMVESLWNKSG